MTAAIANAGGRLGAAAPSARPESHCVRSADRHDAHHNGLQIASECPRPFRKSTHHVAGLCLRGYPFQGGWNSNEASLLLPEDDCRIDLQCVPSRKQARSDGSDCQGQGRGAENGRIDAGYSHEDGLHHRRERRRC